MPEYYNFANSLLQITIICSIFSKNNLELFLSYNYEFRYFHFTQNLYTIFRKDNGRPFELAFWSICRLP